MLDILRQDIAYALRAFRRAPGFTIGVIATLALGIGANAALFSLADRLFLRQPFGVTDPTTLARIYARSNWSVGNVWEIHDRFSYPAFVALRESLAPRARLAAYMPPDSIRLGEVGGESSVRGVYASSDFVTSLGVRPALGRWFSATEDEMGNGAPVAVIGHALWQRAFAGDSTVIGRVAMIARRRVTIIGVAPAGFTGIDLEPVELWLPLGAFPSTPGAPAWYTSWRNRFAVRAVARVAPGTSHEWLSSVGTQVYRRREIQNIKRNPDSSATIVPGPLLEALGPSIPPRANVAITTRLVGVALIVLIIACANVANLLLARGITRRRELAIRLALGVSRRRLVIQFLIEGTTLALAAGCVAILVGQWGGIALRHLVLSEAEWGRDTFDWRLVGVTIGVALVTGILASLVPALRASRPDLTHSLKAGSRSSTAEHSRLRSTLVVVQAALSIVLLAGAGLFVRSLGHARGVDLGIDADRLLYATVHFVSPDGQHVDRGAQLAIISSGVKEAAARVDHLRGVERTALSTSIPFDGYSMVGLFLQDGSRVPLLDERDPAFIATTPSYFAAMGLRLVRGRLYGDADRAGTEPVIVVNETTARAYWPGREALGQCVHVLIATAACARVVGVVHDSHFDEVVEKSMAALFVPVAQQSNGLLANPIYLVVRAQPSEIGRVGAETRRILHDAFPSFDPPLVQPVSRRVENQLRPWKLGATLFIAFGALSLVVAAMGVYSVIAYSVTQRTHEIGVRVALGARRRQVVGLVLSQGARMTFVGLAVGAVLVLALGPLVAAMLYDTSPRDPAVLAGALTALGLVTVLACVLPAIRASRTDPAIALRAD